MSVLVEETTFVAPRDDLESTFPGGVAALVEAVSRLTDPPTFTCAGDAHLVSIGFRDSSHAQGIRRLLEGLAFPWILVEAESGPMAPATWLEWSVRGGVVRAWLAGTKPGRLAQLVRGKALLRLAVEDGVETFLDLATGAQIRAGEPEPTGTPLFDALIETIDAIGWRHYFSEAPHTFVDLSGNTGLYTSKFYANEVAQLLVCLTRAPLTIPFAARRRVMEFITRANFGMQYGCFELSIDEGVLGMRSAENIMGSTLTETQVRDLPGSNVFVLDKYTPYLMEVIYAKRNVRDAVEAAERT